MAETTNPPSKARDSAWRQISRLVSGQAPERWTVQQVQFSEYSRMAARRALWFLRLVEADSDEPQRKHAQSSAHRQLQTVRVPTDPEHICAPGDPDSKCRYSGAMEPEFAALVKTWNKLLDDLDRSRGIRSSKDLRDIEKETEEFIRRSRPANRFIRLTYSVAPAARQALAQHLGLIFTFAVGLAVCALVEPVRSILMNAPRFTVMVFLAALAPLGFMYIVQRVVFDRRDKRAPWNVGGRVVHRLPVSVEPEPWSQWHVPGDAKWIYLSLGLKVVLHMVLWIVLGLALQTAIRLLGWDEVLLTVYLIVMLWAFVVLVGGAIDFADMHSPSPLRWMMVAGAGVVTLAVLVFDSAIASSVAIAVWLGLMSLWSFRIRNHRTLGVPAAIAVVGLIGILVTEARHRDEVWRPQVQNVPALSLQDWPHGDSTSAPVVVLAASGGGSRAAVFAARTLEALDSDVPDVAANLQAISSVSGGSLASAVYVSRRLRNAGIVTDSPAACSESLSNAVSRDFIQPTIIGLWHEGGRGMGIQRAWEKCPVGLGGITIDRLADAWRDSRKRDGSGVPFPVPLFNSVSLERNAVVISPLSQKFFTSVFDKEARSDSNAYRLIASRDSSGRAVPTWVYYRSGIYDLQDLSGGMNASLSAAVRASANFPFGFPLVEVESRRRLHYSTTVANAALDEVAKMVRLTDGGALSNSGMWPLVPLLVNQRERIGNDRGVLMIVVDASRMPVAGWTDRQGGLLGTILDKNATGERLHLQMLQQLEAAYGGCFGYVYIGIEPRAEFNVYTTWALDRKSLQVVDKAFASAWREVEPQLKEEYKRLQACRNSQRTPLRVGRVPLS